MRLIPITPNIVINPDHIETLMVAEESPMVTEIKMVSGFSIFAPLTIKQTVDFINEFGSRNAHQEVVRTVSEFAG
jgi:hypothetical protein